MERRKIQINALRLIWIFVNIFTNFVWGFNYKPFEGKASCLGEYCNSDILNFHLKIVCTRSKPCIEAQWSTSPSFDSSQKVKYLLKYRIVAPKSLQSNYSIHEMTDTSFQMDTNDKPAFGVTYEFQISKYFKGKYRDPIIKNITLPESVPFYSLKKLHKTEIDSSTIRVTWEAPNPFHGIIIQYEVRYYAVNDEEKTENMKNITETYVILKNLFLAEYKIFVRAYTSAGPGIWSDPLYYYRPSVQDLPVPINVKAYRKSNTELEIKWSLPDGSDDGEERSRVVGFVIFYAPINSNKNVQKHSTDRPDLKANIKGLRADTTYKVQVAAVNKHGLNGNFSIPVEETTKTIPRLQTKTVRQLRCSVLSSKMLKLEWIAPIISTDIDKFEIIYSAKLSYLSTMNLKKLEVINGIRRSLHFESNVQSYSFKLDDLQSNADYTIAVRPIYFNDLKKESFQSLLETNCRTRPSVPDFVNTPIPLEVSEGGKQIKLKLSRCSERNGPLSNYSVIVGAFTATNGDEFPLLKETSEYTITELGLNAKKKEYVGPYMAMSSDTRSLFREEGKNFTEVWLRDDYTEHEQGIQTVNKRLEQHINYKLFMTVCLEEHGNVICKSSNWSQPFNIKEMVKERHASSTSDSDKRRLMTKGLDLSYTVVLVVLLLSGVVLAIACIIVGCIIKQRKWKKRLTNNVNNCDHNRDSVRSSILLKTSLTNGIRSSEKCLLASDIELFKNHANKHSTVPDLVTADSGLMCQDGSKLSPVLMNGSKRAVRGEKTGKETPDKAPTSITNLYQYISELKANDGALLQSEFETLNTNLDDRFSWQRSNIDSNKSKNRYANVVAYDHTSVLLHPVDDIIGSDYINANYIDGYQKQKAYIATQGPLPDTTDDFWRMVWEQNSTAIVMMTRLEERSGVKCHQYWPNRGFICYGQMIVCHIESFSFAYYTIRVFELRHNKFAEKREIHHFQFTAWPDHGVPKLSTPLLMFIRRYRSMTKPDSGVTVVHCSAGVGRTGAFIVIEAQLERIKHEKTVSVFNYVSKIRCQRNYMVQTQAQYLFILETLLEAVEDGNTEVLACNLHSHVSKLSQIGLSGPNELSGFELEFSKLNSLASNRDRHGVMLADFVKAAGNQSVNLTKNKVRNIIPYDWNRVILPAIRGIDGSDYINSSYIDGYRDKRAYIAAQSPLPSSVEDFWRMIWDQHCGVVVILNQPQEEKCHIYWPGHKSIRYQFFVVDPVVEYNMPNYILREFKVTDARDGEFRTLRQFQFTQWPSHGVPKESDSILDFIRQVHKTKEQFGHMEPMIVHCSTGSGRTGVFIALSIVIDRLQQESVVDMYQTVKLLHKQRLGLVQTEEQYEYCYKSVMDYLSYYEKNEKNCEY